MYFTSKKAFSRKLLFFGSLCLTYVACLWAFQTYEPVYKNWKPYYLKSQMAAADYRIKSVFAGTALVLFGKSEDVTVPTLSLSSSTQSIPVLLYHGVLGESDGVNISLATFKDQMFALKTAGWKTVSIAELLAFLRGEMILPQKSFLITFDDGRKDSYYPTDPIFRALDFDAVMFAIESYAHLEKSSYYLTENELRNMEESDNWEIESHTKTHRDLSTIGEDELDGEIVGSKKGLEALFKKSIIGFAFPFGGLGETSFEPSAIIVERARAAYPLSFFQFLTNRRFSQNYSDSEESNFLVKRISVHPDWSGRQLVSILESGQAKTLPIQATLNESDGWVSTLWGDVVFQNGKMVVQALAEGTGSAVILDGSRLWKDYQFTVRVGDIKGSNAYLWARYKDDHNYAACNFGKTLAHVEETFGGNVRVIRGEQVDSEGGLVKEGDTIAIRVQGRQVTCFVNGVSVVSTDFLNPELDIGGVGVKAWDPLLGVASLTVEDAFIEPISGSVTSTTTMSAVSGETLVSHNL